MKWHQNFNYARWAFINFIVLSIFGALLRYLQLYGLPFVNYQFILHAHSHFAFSGWMFFSIALLIARLSAGDGLTPGFKYVLFVALISAYGMLASFSWQGYRAVSISFSTLFVLVTFRFTYLVFKGNLLKGRVNETTFKLIRGALVFLCLSSLGPFALGSLAALGLRNTPYYQDAIYFYLHFQMNGFMLLAAIGLLASTLLNAPANNNSGKWLNLFIYSTIPLYFIFTLWAKPGIGLWVLSCIGSGLNLLSWLALCFNFRSNWGHLSFLEKAALLAQTLKCFFQALICIPAVGDWTFLNRDLIIGYIHLLTLGIIMPLLIAQFIKTGFVKPGKLIIAGNWMHIILVVIYLCLLFIQPLLSLFSVVIPGYQFLLFILCLLFLPVGILLLSRVKSVS
ncbi:MAG: hypothetical protein ABI113_11930 [Mucilaginibacter sp.]